MDNKLAQGIKVVSAAMSGHLSSIFRTHVMKGEKLLPQVILCTSCIHCNTHLQKSMYKLQNLLYFEKLHMVNTTQILMYYFSIDYFTEY